MFAKGWYIGPETQTSRANTISLNCHCSTDTIKLKCSCTTKIWNSVIDGGEMSSCWCLTKLHHLVNFAAFAWSSPSCFILVLFFYNKAASQPTENAAMQVHEWKNQPSLCVRTASRVLTIHLALRATMKSKSRTWRQQDQNRNQESGNQAWRAERAGVRESKVGVCNGRWQSVKPQSRGPEWIRWAVDCQLTAASSQMQRRRMCTVSLTDLAVAEMYWTTISRLVLRSFSRSGALRSSFRFMSSWRHKQRGESFHQGREPALRAFCYFSFSASKTTLHQ